MPGGRAGSEDFGEEPRPTQDAADEPGPLAAPAGLLRACAELGDWRAWDRFIAAFRPVIVAAVRRTARRYVPSGEAGLIDDLEQEVYVRLCANGARVLREFQPRHPRAAFGYLAVIAINVVHDYFRRKGLVQECADGLDGIDPADGGASMEYAEWLLLEREIDDFLRRHGPERDLRIFWLYYRQGWSAKEIAALPAFELGVKGIESVLHCATALVRTAFAGAEGSDAANSLSG